MCGLTLEKKRREDGPHLKSRLGDPDLHGHGIRDVRIFALQGRVPLALDRLRDAIDGGFVSQIPFAFWDLDTDPLLEPLRGEPRWSAMRTEIRQRLDTIKANVDEAISTGNWQPLRDRTIAQSVAASASTAAASLDSSLARVR